MSYSIYAYPWNLSTANYQQVLSDIQTIGLQGISLAVSYHAGKFIHPQSRRHRVYFPEDGVVYFQPQSHYGKIKPAASRLLEQGDILASLTDQNSVFVNAWTVLFHNTRLGMLHPNTTVKNAFGNSYVYSLCPAHPDVRQYALTLCNDIATHYSINTLLLETPGYLAYNHGYHHEFAQVKPNSYLDALLGLCFCEHCMAGARSIGIDIAALQQQVMGNIDAFLDDAPFTSEKTALIWLENDVYGDEELSAFIEWRCNLVTSLVKEIRHQTPPSIKVKVISTTQNSHSTSILEGHQLQALSDASDGLEIPFYQPSLAQVNAEAEVIVTALNNLGCQSALVRPGWPDIQSQQQLVETLDHIKAIGINDIAFYNYDMLLPINLQWLQEAINH